MAVPNDVHRSAPAWLRSREREALWLLLAAAVIVRVCLVVFSPTAFGYVWDFYYEGVRVLHERGRLPEAADCWQCYHPPLFYVLGWPLYAFGRWLDAGGGETAALRWLGGLPLICGGVTVFYGFRLLRLVRCRGGLLLVGTGLLLAFPCLFFSSYGADADIVVTAILSALIFYLTRDAALRPPQAALPSVRLGVLAGLAAATKYSGLVGLASIVAVLGVHVLAGRSRAAAVRSVVAVLVISGLVGGWKYVDNIHRYGTPLHANGAASDSFSLKKRRSIGSTYEFTTLRMRDLFETIGPGAVPGRLTGLPVYRSVFTTLHGLGWSDLNFFSEPTRHGDPTHPYPVKRQVWTLTASVLLLGFVPEVLAIAGIAVTARRRLFLPVALFTLLSALSYGWWLVAQAEWGLKTKYILFLLPPGVLYAVVGLAWLWRRAPPTAGVTVAGLLTVLIVLTHVYLFIFSIG